VSASAAGAASASPAAQPASISSARVLKFIGRAFRGFDFLECIGRAGAAT
jgi:hypothetical protein